MKNILQHILENNILADTHCHLSMSVYKEDCIDVVRRADTQGVHLTVGMSVDLDNSKEVVAQAEKFPSLQAAIGIDPEVYIEGSTLVNFSIMPQDTWQLEDYLVKDEASNIVMIGETGLDNYWNKKNDLSEQEEHKSRQLQRALFHEHILLAQKYNMPLSIHSREAIHDCLDILKELESGFSTKKMRGVFHSMTPEEGDTEVTYYQKIRDVQDNGFMVGLNGIITYKNAHILRNSVLRLLEEQGVKKLTEPQELYQAGFVLETDGPYLAPDGKRGERNEPAYVRLIFEFLQNALDKT
ncbi:TatD family hydrolase [Candidatus Dojkabacteria bacterium]|uniref:TatD family hydrolase n=1 Tax=Candidatus Dojkabacteria bacterium TaxID=2099670 RepID=A0A955L893_9BACT|nr:TatD family hydrolase [Candidatus Dojkabacteria bacterium]